MTLRDLADTLGLNGPPLTVLVVEDQVSLLARLTDFASELGHTVISLLGVRSIEDGIAFGPDLAREGIRSVDLRTVDVAFLDHYFLSRQHNGRTLTLALREAGEAKILAMSSSEEANQAMLAAGAILSVRKAELMEALGL